MWILYAVIGAIGKALTSFIRKKLANTNPAIYVFISSIITASAITLVALILSGESISSIKYAPLAIVISSLVQIVAVRANMYAFKHGELSYITPMFALTPLYAAIIAYFTIGETPSSTGLLGILAIVIGVYVVTSSKDVGIKETLKHIASNSGARAGMLIPLTYAVSATLNKEAINEGVTPLVSVAAIGMLIGLGHIYVLFKDTDELKQTFRNKKLMKNISLASVFAIISVGFAALALNEAFASYTLSIRRLDILITVILGWKFMNESNFTRRITGAIIMTVGVVLISFS